MQQAFKTMMNHTNAQNNQFNNPPFAPGSSFPFPKASSLGSAAPPPFPSYPASSSGPTTSPLPTSQTPVTLDVPATKVEAAASAEQEAAPTTDAKEEIETTMEHKKFAFADVSPEETLSKIPFSDVEVVTKTGASKDARFAKRGFLKMELFLHKVQVPLTVLGPLASLVFMKNLPAVNYPFWGNPFTSALLKFLKLSSTAYFPEIHDSELLSLCCKRENTGPFLSVDALEKMMEYPIVQRMVYPHLPEDMRNPTTFKWMIQNPQYRQQLQEMLNNMGGSTEWDTRMMESLKNFDLGSPEVKQRFGLVRHPNMESFSLSNSLKTIHQLSLCIDQIGLTPEEAISKIMENPDIALAFQNPRIQQAIMDCSQNPLSIAKYQNDKEDPRDRPIHFSVTAYFPGDSLIVGYRAANDDDIFAKTFAGLHLQVAKNLNDC